MWFGRVIDVLGGAACDDHGMKFGRVIHVSGDSACDGHA
jgi:hypothetical protein